MTQEQFVEIHKLGVKTPPGTLGTSGKELNEMKYELLYEITTTENGNYHSKLDLESFLEVFEKIGDIFYKDKEFT